MIKFYVEELPTIKRYMIATPDGIVDYTGMCMSSFSTVHARLFGLTLGEWYRMMRDVCKAELKGKGGLYKTVSFADRAYAENYCKELNRRFEIYYKAKGKK